MPDRAEVSIDVIIHATEDLSKFYKAFEDMFGIKEDVFSVQNLVGHYDNPITMISTKITKKMVKQFMKNFVEKLSASQIKEIIEELDIRMSNSTLHLRLDKQEFVRGNIKLNEKDPIKLKIYTPIYSKKDTEKIFRELFDISN